VICKYDIANCPVWFGRASSFRVTNNLANKYRPNVYGYARWHSGSFGASCQGSEQGTWNGAYDGSSSNHQDYGLLLTILMTWLLAASARKLMQSTSCGFHLIWTTIKQVPRQHERWLWRGEASHNISEKDGRWE
jgi:hypothetical protein